MEVNEEQPRVEVATQTDPFLVSEEFLRTAERFNTEIKSLKNFIFSLSETLSNIVRILTNMNRSQIRPRYSVTYAVPNCENPARVVASCTLCCPQCIQCSAANPDKLSLLRLPHYLVCGEVANNLLIRNDISIIQALSDNH